MTSRLRVLLLALALAPLGAGCKRNESTSPQPTAPSGGASGSSTSARAESGLATVRMSIGAETFTLQIADTEAARRRGLMYRESLPADHGMIFVFDTEEPLSFWMEATLIPLDILYLDRTGRVVSIKPMRPRDRAPVPSDGPAMYAIELNRGTAAKLGVRPGDTLTLPPEVTSARPEPR